MGVQRRRRAQDRQPEERVLGHLEEGVDDPGRLAHPPRVGIEGDHRPPEQAGGHEVQDVLELVDDRLLERRIEDRREVGAPHREGEQQPRHDRERHDPDRQRVEDRQDQPLARFRACESEQEGDRRAEREQRRRDQGQQDVLDHVEAEQCRVVALDRRLERDEDRPEAEQPAHRADRRDGVAGVRPIDRPDRPEVAGRGQDDRDDDGRVERPGEQDPRQLRGRGRAAVGGRDRGEREPAGGRAEPDREPPADARDWAATWCGGHVRHSAPDRPLRRSGRDRGRHPARRATGRAGLCDARYHVRVLVRTR